jgi:thiamine biosynthesis lipoprotein
MRSFEFRAMNTTVQMMAAGLVDRLPRGFAFARRLVLASERRFSRFRPESELSQLNRSAGSLFQASPALFEVLELSLQLYHLTDGLFDPSILPDLVAAGYDRSMDVLQLAGESLPPAPLGAVRIASPLPFSTLQLDGKKQSVYLPEGLQLDLGGIAKGWIAAQAAQALSRYSRACAVSAGGDMQLVSLPPGKDAWQVELEDPRQPESALALLRLPPGGLATSTTTRRTWRQGGVLRHHIIDPRSGQPAGSAWLSVTVHAPQLVQAEAFAKALLIAGPQGAPGLAARLPGLRYLAVLEDGSLWGSPESKELLDVA